MLSKGLWPFPTWSRTNRHHSFAMPFILVIRSDSHGSLYPKLAKYFAQRGTLLQYLMYRRNTHGSKWVTWTSTSVRWQSEACQSRVGTGIAHVPSLLRHCGTGPDKRPVSLLPSWQMVAQAKHAKDLDASASKLQSNHAELQENAAQFLLRHCPLQNCRLLQKIKCWSCKGPASDLQHVNSSSALHDGATGVFGR